MMKKSRSSGSSKCLATALRTGTRQTPGHYSYSALRPPSSRAHLLHRLDIRWSIIFLLQRAIVLELLLPLDLFEVLEAHFPCNKHDAAEHGNAEIHGPINRLAIGHQDGGQLRGIQARGADVAGTSLDDDLGAGADERRSLRQFFAQAVVEDGVGDDDPNGGTHILGEDDDRDGCGELLQGDEALDSDVCLNV